MAAPKGPIEAAPAAGATPHNERRQLDHRQMRSAAFRNEQWDHRRDPHVAPLNDLVDRLIEDHGSRWMPYIAPITAAPRPRSSSSSKVPAG